MKLLHEVPRGRFCRLASVATTLALPLAAGADGAPPPAVAAAPAARGLCAADEITLFSCPAARGRQIALCAAGTVGAVDARAQYRFGRFGQVELAYPADAATGPQVLLAAHYSRAGVDRWSVRFETPAAKYVVYDWLEAGEPRHSGVDVTVKQPRSRELHITCAGPVQIDPPAIAARLRCDRASALASCP